MTNASATLDFDLAIVGSGFSGSLLAMIVLRLGRSVILLERGQHPRFAIGESSTPLANLLLEELARRYDLPEVLPLTKWGTWQAKHPEIACGLKRGFTFYHHAQGKHWKPLSDRRNELMVAASPHDRIADTHWYRPDFDHFLVRQAQALGAEYLDQVAISEVAFDHDSVALHADHAGRPLNVRARFLIDASGPRGFLHRALRLREIPFPRLPATQTLYSHFTDVARWEALHPSPETPPYPPDDAALHHVFDGGWVWVLRFNNGITSAGVVATPKIVEQFRLSDGAPAWPRFLASFPSLAEQFRDAKPVVPFVYSPRLHFRSECVAGERWALLPSAAGIVDPLLSTGFPLTLLGITRLARILENDWNSAQLTERLRAYEQQTLKELLIAESMVAALYACMDNSPKFTAVSLLYFAAASFSETARRLNRAELAGESFLAVEHPEFGPRLRGCLEVVWGNKGNSLPALAEQIRAAVRTIDVAGLSDPSRRNWYPARAEDALAAAPKLGVSEDEILALLRRAGW